MLESTTRDDSEVISTPTSVGPSLSREDQAPVDAGYRIGAASRLTGIAADTLRVWERRYGVVTPRRSVKGGRRYSREDVSRLALIKQLVDAGHAIGSVAGLGREALQERLDAQPLNAITPSNAHQAASGCTVAVLGEALPARLRAHEDQVQGLALVTVTRDPDAFARAVSEHHPNVIVLEYPTLKGRVLKEVNRLLRISRARRAIVVYAFAKRDTARRLRSSDIVPLRALSWRAHWLELSPQKVSNCRCQANVRCDTRDIPHGQARAHRGDIRVLRRLGGPLLPLLDGAWSKPPGTAGGVTQHAAVARSPAEWGAPTRTDQPDRTLLANSPSGIQQRPKLKKETPP